MAAGKAEENCAPSRISRVTVTVSIRRSVSGKVR